MLEFVLGFLAGSLSLGSIWCFTLNGHEQRLQRERVLEYAKGYDRGFESGRRLPRTNQQL